MIRSAMTALVLFPAGAWACGTMPGPVGGCSGGHGCGALGMVLMAAVAALGVWILRLVEKDGIPVKRAGQVVGWTLAVVGLGGFLCGAINHGMKSRPKQCNMPGGMTNMPLPMGHPPLGPMPPAPKGK